MKASAIQIKALRAEVGALGDRIIEALELNKPAPDNMNPFEIRVSQDLCGAFLEIKSMLHLYWDKATTDEANTITLLGTVTNTPDAPTKPPGALLSTACHRIPRLPDAPSAIRARLRPKIRPFPAA